MEQSRGDACKVKITLLDLMTSATLLPNKRTFFYVIFVNNIGETVNSDFITL